MSSNSKPARNHQVMAVKVIIWLHMSRNCWRRMNGVIQCLHDPNRFRQCTFFSAAILSLPCSGPGSRPDVLSFTLFPDPWLLLRRLWLLNTGPLLLSQAPRPDRSSNQTAMAVFSNSQRRFHASGTGQVARVFLPATVSQKCPFFQNTCFSQLFPFCYNSYSNPIKCQPK